MTRTEYLNQLEKHLRALPKADYIEAMDYFTEYFDEAGDDNEQAVMLELGTPREASNEIITNILDKKLATDKKGPRTRAQIVWISLLAIFAAPLGIPVLLALLAFLLALIVLICSLFIAAIAVDFALILVSATFLWESITLIPTALPVLLMGFGTGLAALGAAILLGLLIWLLLKLSYRFILFLIRKLIRRGTSYEN